MHAASVRSQSPSSRSHQLKDGLLDVLLDRETFPDHWRVTDHWHSAVIFVLVLVLVLAHPGIRFVCLLQLIYVVSSCLQLAVLFLVFFTCSSLPLGLLFRFYCTC